MLFGWDRAQGVAYLTVEPRVPDDTEHLDGFRHVVDSAARLLAALRPVLSPMRPLLLRLLLPLPWADGL